MASGLGPDRRAQACATSSGRARSRATAKTASNSQVQVANRVDSGSGGQQGGARRRRCVSVAPLVHRTPAGRRSRPSPPARRSPASRGPTCGQSAGSLAPCGTSITRQPVRSRLERGRLVRRRRPRPGPPSAGSARSTVDQKARRRSCRCAAARRAVRPRPASSTPRTADHQAAVGPRRRTRSTALRGRRAGDSCTSARWSSSAPSPSPRWRRRRRRCR